jgi:hypothetical protein
MTEQAEEIASQKPVCYFPAYCIKLTYGARFLLWSVPREQATK